MENPLNENKIDQNEQLKHTEKSKGTLCERFERVTGHVVDGSLVGGAGSVAFQMAENYMNSETIIDPSQATLALFGALAGATVLGTYGVAKESLGALLGTEIKPKESANYIKKIGSHALDGLIAGYFSGAILKTGQNIFYDNPVLDPEALLYAGIGAAAGTALMGTYGAAKEGLDLLINKISNGSIELPKAAACGGFLFGSLANIGAIALNNYLTGDPVLGDPHDLAVAGLTGAAIGAALGGTLGIIGARSVVDEDKPAQSYDSGADKNPEFNPFECHGYNPDKNTETPGPEK